jgi:hypothetical protein
LRKSLAIAWASREISGIENHLDDAGAVSQINKNQLTVITAAVHPPGQLDFLSDVPSV